MSGYRIAKIEVDMVRLGRFIIFALLAFGWSAVPASAQTARGDAGGIDYTAVSREMRGFEAVVNKALISAFDGQSFALSQQTKGAYIQGYGVTFTFIINIHRALVTPFGVVPGAGTEITPEQKRRRIEDLKDTLGKIILDNAWSLRHVRREDAITIVGFFEDRNFPEEPNQNKTVVLSVMKKDLDDIAGAKDRWKDFKLRMKSVEY